MTLDPHNWSPLSIEEIAEVFEGMPVPWWVAGGWALDLVARSSSDRAAYQEGKEGFIEHILQLARGPEEMNISEQ